MTVGSVSSLAAGAKAGTLRGAVVNRTGHAVDAKVSVRIQRYGAPAKFVGRTAVRVPADALGAVHGRGQAPERAEPRQLLPGRVHAGRLG